MEIIPAVDIRGGRCVRLVQGDYARETVFGDDPVAMALHWAGEGARRLHVVDLDAAREGWPVNEGIIRRIVRDSGIRVQVAGGVRDLAAVRKWAEAGADRIVVGTLAVEHPDVVEEAARRYGERIALAIDAREGRAAVRGWIETSDTSVEEFVRDMAARGVGRFIYTDIARDGTYASPGFEALAPLRAWLAQAGLTREGEPAPLIYSGGVTAVEDVVRLAEEDIEGVIIGSALYTGRIDLHAAQRALSVGDDW
ncbi:MAG TPA: 1-(5-phosphoribosyl)-5-[(5-phosphoribosylamino)methylideneamino]imidazole-4-carboxamide isomerase [Methylomirabilota bacterium]|nr:1-(5-phosphoribosyl)-5-[(5-phosphoribosylamino)methylideneamino]imidazole-4-carboxamide isomerase [Methylomirabilota bacterium]